MEGGGGSACFACPAPPAIKSQAQSRAPRRGRPRRHGGGSGTQGIANSSCGACPRASLPPSPPPGPTGGRGVSDSALHRARSRESSRLAYRVGLGYGPRPGLDPPAGKSSLAWVESGPRMHAVRCTAAPRSCRTRRRSSATLGSGISPRAAHNDVKAEAISERKTQLLERSARGCRVSGGVLSRVFQFFPPSILHSVRIVPAKPAFTADASCANTSSLV